MTEHEKLAIKLYPDSKSDVVLDINTVRQLERDVYLKGVSDFNTDDLKSDVALLIVRINNKIFSYFNENYPEERIYLAPLITDISNTGIDFINTNEIIN